MRLNWSALEMYQDRTTKIIYLFFLLAGYGLSPSSAHAGHGGGCDISPGGTTFVSISFVYPVGASTAMPTATGFLPNGYIVTQKFNNDAGHTGVDLATFDNASGGEVRAVGAGRVVFVQEVDKGWGHMIRIEHRLPGGRFVYSQYAHLLENSITHTCGNLVFEGQRIGSVGSTGAISSVTSIVMGSGLAKIFLRVALRN